ncbi:MAG TPA: CocE/NonD family hydrolase [Acidimicrobiales bacterium]|nr:CocE/NonD family hydrolase [Acidimicrobiales bacterium]
MTLVSRILGSLAQLPPATTGAISVERDLRATMPDGIVLLADRWLPTDALRRRAPVILLRTPYGRRQWAGMIGRLFAERGYQVVIQSCRGTFGSGGNWIPFRNERADGRATLDWIVNQPWFTGTLATFGPSYLGLTQWAVAQDPPACLKAMALGVTAANFRDAVVYPSDCFALGTSLAWLQLLEHQEQGWLRLIRSQRDDRRRLSAAYGIVPLANADTALVGRRVPFFQDWLEHEKPDDRWWEPVHFGRELGDVPPSTLVAGWYDLFLPSQLDDYQALRSAGRSVRLTIGPWSHSSPGTIAASLRDGLEWFDSHLGEGSGRAPRNVARVFVMGARRWVEFPDWPPPSEEQLWYLGGGGVLQRSSPGDDPPDRYRYDPADPTPGLGGPSLNWNDAGPKDQRKREGRPDVLTFTSAVLAEDLTVIGPLSADLHVRSTLDNCDFFVRLCDVSPKGRSRNLSDGIARLKPGALPRSPDGSFSVRIGMWPTANRFLRGHRIRLQVSSGAHPLFARNPGTGEPLATAVGLRAADQEILHDAEHLSCLRMPVTRL